MKAVLRLTLAWFSVVPLQSGIAIAGAGLLALALLPLLTQAPTAVSQSLVLLGSFLIAPWPAVTGGWLLRYASLRSVLHLRPHGRALLLASATLTITLIAMLATLPVLLGSLPGAPRVGQVMFDGISAGDVFLLAWSLTALLWVAGFIISGSRVLSLMIGFLPIIVFPFGGRLASAMTHQALVFALGAAAWAGFALWYTTVPSIRRVLSQAEAMGSNLGEAAAAFIQSRFKVLRGAISRDGATAQYLFGASSRARHALSIIVSVLTMMLVMTFSMGLVARKQSGVQPGAGAGMLIATMLFLAIFMISSPSLGFRLTRCARLLWLRAGMDRAALFARAERNGLPAALLPVSVALLGSLVMVLLEQPEQARAVMLYGATQLAVGACLFYAGLSLTRGWYVPDILRCLVLGALFMVEIVKLRPWGGGWAAVTPEVLAIVLLVTPVQRWQARHRWLALDWRVARPLPVMHRTF